MVLADVAVTSCRELRLACWVTKIEQIYLHHLQVLLECLILRKHLYVPIVELELGHGVSGADLELLHVEPSDLLVYNHAFFVTFWLDFDFLSPIFLLNILIAHDIV